ncbi:hypothetical protein NIES2130_00285 [Scytonema sp. HK-05]|nr:hypothetical protein NIES2130_00285 [Scytonema sp. HK-05]
MLLLTNSKMQSSYTLKFFARWRDNGCKKVGTPPAPPYSFFIKQRTKCDRALGTALWASRLLATDSNKKHKKG